MKPQQSMWTKQLLIAVFVIIIILIFKQQIANVL